MSDESKEEMAWRYGINYGRPLKPSNLTPTQHAILFTATVMVIVLSLVAFVWTLGYSPPVDIMVISSTQHGLTTHSSILR